MTKKKRGSKERGKNARKLGAIAEDMISLFATQVDLVATKSQRDWEGWDLASDLPSRTTDLWGLPTPPIICRFQIKATETTNRTVRIARENIVRMAQQPIPWFLMLVRYANGAPSKIDVVHFGKGLVDEVLRWAVTQPQASGFQLACDTRGVEIAPTPQAWLTAIEQLIGDKATYGSRKAEWNDSAGRTTQPRFRFNIVTRNTTEEEMANFFLGLAPKMKVDDARIFEERFGIVRLRQNIGEATMEIPSLAPSARVRLTARSPTQLASVDCLLFTTHPWMPTPSSGHRVRLKMKYFDMLIAAVHNTSISLNVPETIDLNAVAEEVRFFHVLNTADEMTVTSGENVGTLTPYRFDWTANEADFFQAVLTTHQLFTTLGLRTTSVKLAALLHGEGLALARAILGDPKARVLSLSFKNREATNLPGVIVSSFAVQDDHHKSGFVIRFNGQAKADDGVIFEVSELKSVDRFAFPRKTAAEKLRALLKQHADRIEEAEGVVVDYIVDS